MTRENLKKKKKFSNLNVLYEKEMKFCPVYISRYNSNCRKHIIHLMISNEEGWDYLAVKSYLHC